MGRRTGKAARWELDAELRRIELAPKVLDAIRSREGIKATAKRLGISIGLYYAVRQEVFDALRGDPEKIAEVRAFLDAEHRALIESHREAAQMGDTAAAGTVLKALAGLAKLHGADAPEVRDITIRTGSTPAEARRVMQELFGGNVGPDTLDDESATDAAAGASDDRGAPQGAPTH